MKHGLALLALLALLFAASASAQQFTLFAGGGKSMTSYHGQVDLQAVNVEFTERRSKDIEVGVAFGSDLLWQPRTWFGGENERVRGVNASLVVRRYFRSRANVYGELASGPMWAEKRVPAQTSHFNFLSYAGAGVVIGPEWSTPLMVGFRFAHVSNAGLTHHNPGINFSALVAGLRLRRP